MFHLVSNLLKVMERVLSCPYVEEHTVDFFVYKVPVMILLIGNTLFLIWIMLVISLIIFTQYLLNLQIVVSKLHFQTSVGFDRRHFRAAKALMVVTPVLGFTYILTLTGPTAEYSPLGYSVFQGVRAVLLSSQGAVITLPYCYLNTEVGQVLLRRWNRWRMLKALETECPSTRKSSIASEVLSSAFLLTLIKKHIFWIL